MAVTGQIGSSRPRAIPSLRWWIGGILFASMVINCIDRQTLSILAPYLKQEYHWTNSDYANIAIAFRVAYSIGQTACGRQIDRLGTRLGLTISVTWYSIVSLLTSLASGIASFAGFRFLLGAGESANWPGASKAVSEWFPNRDRGLAAALYDSGSSVGGAITPFLILPVYLRWGWRVPFVIPWLLGFLWLIAWRRMYYLPQEHPRISDAERQMILADRPETEGGGKPLPR
jgi:MFS transporter, ACS family, hexuronate transporter